MKKLDIWNDIKIILDKNPDNLSGGQRQIIVLTRLLYTKKKLILLDEPTASLDSNTKKFAFKILNYLKQQNCIIIVVSHDNALINIADEIINLKELS